MTGETIAQVIIALLGGGTLTGIVSELVRRHRDAPEAPTPDEAKEAVVAVEARRAGIPDPTILAATVEAMQERYERDLAAVQEQVASLRASIAELQREHRLTIAYVWALREDAHAHGYQPLPWPDDLAGYHAPSSTLRPPQHPVGDLP